MTFVCEYGPLGSKKSIPGKDPDAAHIGNFILSTDAFPNGKQIGQERMTYILFLINKEYLKEKGTRIFSNQIVATKRGIEIEGIPPIKTYFYLRLMKDSDGKKRGYNGRDRYINNLIYQILDEVEDYTTEELRLYVTQPGSAWDKARHAYGVIRDRELKTSLF